MWAGVVFIQMTVRVYYKLTVQIYRLEGIEEEKGRRKR